MVARTRIGAQRRVGERDFHVHVGELDSPCGRMSAEWPRRTSLPHTSPRNRSQFSPRTLRFRVSLQPRRTIAAVRPGNSPMVASPSGWRGTRGPPHDLAGSKTRREVRTGLRGQGSVPGGLPVPGQQLVEPKETQKVHCKRGRYKRHESTVEQVRLKSSVLHLSTSMPTARMRSLLSSHYRIAYRACGPKQHGLSECRADPEGEWVRFESSEDVQRCGMEAEA